MRTSESTKELDKAMSQAQAAFPKVIKESDNPFFKSKYADLASLINAVQEVLGKHGLKITQHLETEITEQATFLCTITRLSHESGEFEESTLKMPLVDIKPQTMGSCSTYCRRYALQAVLRLAGEDDDGNAASAGEIRSGRQARANEQPSAVKEFKGKALDQKRGQSDTGPFLRFNLHNEESVFVSFNESTFDTIETEGLMLTGTAEAKRDSKGIIWYKVTRIEAEVQANPTAQAAASSLFPEAETKPKTAARTVAQSLNGLFTGTNATKHKRLIETLIGKHPVDLQVDIAANFVARVKRESTTSEAGLLTCLDIAVQEVTDEAALEASEQGGHDDELGY